MRKTMLSRSEETSKNVVRSFWSVAYYNQVGQAN